MKVLLAVLACLASTIQAKVSYENYEVLQVVPKTIEQLEVLRELEVKNAGLDFWSRPSYVNRTVDVMVPPNLQEEVSYIFNSLNLESHISIKNVQELIDEEAPKTRSQYFGWTQYHTLEEINDWLQQLQYAYPNLVTVISGGVSYERRSLLGVRISFSPRNGNRIAFIEAGMHAREWIAPATATYVINELLTSRNVAFRKAVEHYDWYIFPVTNPDGFAYTHSATGERLWRKTRVPYGNFYGADPNRNWDFQWRNSSAYANPETYPGPYPFSEPSAKSFSEFIQSIGHNIKIYLSLHSYSQFLMYPYGYTKYPVNNQKELHEVATTAARALYYRHGTEYRVGGIAETIYTAFGCSLDWVKEIIGTRFIFTYELRGPSNLNQGNRGFILPPAEILPNCEEFVDSLVAMVQEIMQRE